MIVILFNEHLKKTNNENFNTPYQLHPNASLMAGLTLRRNYNFEIKMVVKDILWFAFITGLRDKNFLK